MRRVLMFLTLVTALLLGGVPAQAIINGVEDGNEHPNVGAVIWHFGDIDEYVFVCSGSLVTQQIFLTAAHCDPAFTPPEWQTIVAGVTFETALDLSTFVPASQFVRHPDYDDAAWPYTPDIGVIHLAEPVVGIELVELPEAGLVDAIRSEPAFRRQLLTQVGYGQVGVTHGGGPPQQIYPNIRKYASGWVRLEKGKPTGLDVDYLFRTAHPGGPGGDGGTGCFGDSGGPFFLGDAASNQQVGVFSGTGAVGPDGILCRAENLAFRLDTATARAFLCGQDIAAACETGATVAQDNTEPIVSKKTAKESVTKKAAKDKQGKQGKQGKRGDQKHHDKHKARRR